MAGSNRNFMEYNYNYKRDGRSNIYKFDCTID